MSLFLPATSLVIFSAVIIVACVGHSAGPNQPEQGRSRVSSELDAASLIAKLRAASLDIDPGGGVEQPFFSVTGTMIKVHGEDVQIFQYSSAAAAEAQAVPIAPDGSAIGNAKPFWVGSPHFYKSGRLLVLYVGDTERVRQVLEAMLGRQFAGRR